MGPSNQGSSAVSKWDDPPGTGAMAWHGNPDWRRQRFNLNSSNMEFNSDILETQGPTHVEHVWYEPWKSWVVP